VKSKTLLTIISILFSPLIYNCPIEYQNKDITAQSIVEKMATQYANASSYEDTGVVMDVKEETSGHSETVIKFKTYFVRPNFFRFEWTDRSVVTSEERLSVVWNNGKQTFRYYSWADPAVEEKENTGFGIASATGVSRGSAHTIPTLLMKEVGGFGLVELTNLSLLGEEHFEGEDCYILRGYHPQKFPINIWISKRDFLLRKTKEPEEDGSYKVEIHRHVKLDGKITPELFNFTPPTKPKSYPRLSWLRMRRR
jgi:outer membrane lipoprotein-sorting protein